ncbi:Heterokaryon incompatibility protein 6 [Cladobotryum mycophilum]|uniref:Heterokaryon incompatibility protein 6 n=1 Tax=Cladobotryum mycophilum TaxID=491253 RepID=A0ABR0T0W3_9HYPO
MAGLEEGYSKLPDSSSIRILQLYGTEDPNETIRFDRHIISLNAKEVAPYQAISYTWSGQEAVRLVYANNRPSKVTKNVEDVMKRLRPTKQGEFIYLWIDAICINQQDDEEKSAQVKIMVDIYAKAQRINIWLGQGTELTDLALRWMEWVSLPFSLFTANHMFGVYMAMSSNDSHDSFWDIANIQRL